MQVTRGGDPIMTRGELKAELGLILLDPVVEDVFNRWIEEERLALASEYELPALRLRVPTTLAVTTATWLYSMPATFQKMLFQVRDADADGGNRLRIHRELLTIEQLDPNHDETDTHVTDVAQQGGQLGIYPLATETLSLWFYQRPTALTLDTQSPTEIPSEFHASVLIPRVVLRGFRVYPELARSSSAENTRALDYWRTRLREGLYGSAHTGQIGMINTFGKDRPPMRHGGSDPLP